MLADDYDYDNDDIVHCFCVNMFVSTLVMLLHCVQQWVGCKYQCDFHLGEVSLDLISSECSRELQSHSYHIYV